MPKNLNAYRLRSVLDYDPKSGVFRWIEPPKYHPRMKGYSAGCITTGYVLIRIDGAKYKAHQLAWLYMNGKWAEQDIDHINGCPFDNRISNLRLATNSQNQANKRRNAGKSLPKGVRTTSGGRYCARISFRKNLITLGTFDSPDEAKAAYAAAAKKYYGDYARID